MLSEEEKKAIKILGTFEFRQKTINYNKIDIGDVDSTKIVLNLITKLQKENEELKSDNLEKARILEIFDDRKYRKKYLKERRKEEPNLLYPEGDEIYKRYYEQKKQIDLMALAILNYDDQLIISRYKNIDNVKNTFAKLAKKGE